MVRVAARVLAYLEGSGKIRESAFKKGSQFRGVGCFTRPRVRRLIGMTWIDWHQEPCPVFVGK
jgi:hypothetical protein